MSLTLERTGDAGRSPLASAERFAGRNDVGECPPKYDEFLDQAREAMCLARYSYRTEKSYLNWVRRFVIFVRPGSRRELVWSQAEEYFDYLTLVDFGVGH